MQLSLIILFPKSFLFGISYMPPEKNFDYEEINVFLGIIQIQYRFNNEQNNTVV